RASRSIERLVDLPPTETLQRVVDTHRARVAELEAAANRDSQALNSRKIMAARHQLAMAEGMVKEALDRDRLQANRPEGCFCLGQGGRQQTVVAVSAGQDSEGREQVYPVQDPSGGPLM